ncbi:MAG: D-alanyl-D-alanine carboxypeptidase [Clostridia bacterium]|nr:D-alanyl-D-alanine carboxypeptidase [Clostridia bacterium]
MKRKISSFVVLFLVGIILSFSFNFSTNYVDAYSTSAKAMCLIEASSGRVLFNKNENQKLPMASTTKIMTAITAIENCKNLDEKFEVSKRAIGIEGTSLYLREGDKYSMRELLYALMLISGNDASVAIGERISGEFERFVDLMNDTVKKIGLKNSHFENTHGLDAKGHYTSAYDLAKITAYALKNPIFEEIVSTRNIKITNGKNNEVRYLKNKNKLLNTFEGCNGVKTGYTDDAKRCLVASAKRDGMQLVCVVLNCRPMFEECSSLLNQAFEKYKMYNLTKGLEIKTQLNVEDGRKGFVKMGKKKDFLYPLRDDEFSKIKYELSYDKNLIAPVKKGEKVGEYKIYFDNDLLFCEKIYTIESVKTMSFLQKLKKMLSNW